MPKINLDKNINESPLPNYDLLLEEGKTYEVTYTVHATEKALLNPLPSLTTGNVNVHNVIVRRYNGTTIYSAEQR